MSRRFVEAEQVYEDARLYHTDFARSCADLTSLREVLENCDTFDVVEVTRCKDCESACPVDDKGGLVCTIWGAPTEPSRYCSEGERRDSDV